MGNDIVNQNRIENLFKKFPEEFPEKIMNQTEISQTKQIETSKQVETINKKMKIEKNFDTQHISETKMLHEQILQNSDIYVKFLAKKFAVTESISKAIGTGIGEFCKFHDITLSKNKMGKPIVKITGKTHEFIQNQIMNKSNHGNSYEIFISFSDEYIGQEKLVLCNTIIAIQ